MPIRNCFVRMLDAPHPAWRPRPRCNLHSERQPLLTLYRCSVLVIFLTILRAFLFRWELRTADVAFFFSPVTNAFAFWLTVFLRVTFFLTAFEIPLAVVATFFPSFFASRSALPTAVPTDFAAFLIVALEPVARALIDSPFKNRESLYAESRASIRFSRVLNFCRNLPPRNLSRRVRIPPGWIEQGVEPRAARKGRRNHLLDF